MLTQNGEFSTRIELVGACETLADDFLLILASAAFLVMRTSRFLHPGAMLTSFVSEYFPDTTVPHLYFTSPFLSLDALKSARFGDHLVSWLLAMPISESEYDYLVMHGDQAFEDALEAQNVDIFDLQRPPAV